MFDVLLIELLFDELLLLVEALLLFRFGLWWLLFRIVRPTGVWWFLSSLLLSWPANEACRLDSELL